MTESMLTWAASICAAPISTGEDTDLRAKANVVREALFVGPERSERQKNKGLKRGAKDTWEYRACSPTLFERKEERTFMPGEEPHKRLELALATVTATYYDAKTDTALDQINLQGLTRPHKATCLGSLLLPIRRRNVLEEWSSKDIAIFESALCLHGKCFDIIAQLIPNKTTQQIVEFYYFWKHTSHHAPWKKTFKAVDLGDQPGM